MTVERLSRALWRRTDRHTRDESTSLLDRRPTGGPLARRVAPASNVLKYRPKLAVTISDIHSCSERYKRKA